MRPPVLPFGYRRRPTRVVRVGDVGIGGDHPIRVQSMTTPSTTDTEATAGQIVRLVEAGCEIVRVTVPTTGDAESLPGLRRRLAGLGIRVPLVADIHFTPAVAMKAVEHVEKIRVNPGNFADRKRFAVREYSDAEYAAEIERIERAFSPLVLRAKELGVAMRIGTNHGSLSDRILNRYGDTPEGMVESALEFVRIAEAHGYRDLVLSMKASNPAVVLRAYRILVEAMDREGMDYPLHLGVTEAGAGEDGRVKSAIGIGALLEEGIGDTIRVSLTEDPVAEIPVARALVAPYNARRDSGPSCASVPRVRTGTTAPYRRRATRTVRAGPREVGGSSAVVVEVPLRCRLLDEARAQREADAECGARVPEETRAEVLSLTVESLDEIEAAVRLKTSMETFAPRTALSLRARPPLGDASLEALLEPLLRAAHRVHVALRSPVTARGEAALGRLFGAAASTAAAVLVEGSGAPEDPAAAVEELHLAARLAARAGFDHLLLAVDPALGPPPPLVRELASRLDAEGLPFPLVLLDRPEERGADPLLGASSCLGALLSEGIGDAIHVEVTSVSGSRRLAFGILQAARVRMTRTEFISCPSCGRTLFDLEAATARIKASTSHLKGVKIAVMGCVVNGPGEMADADFGYVGWGEDRIALFVGREMVEKDIPTEEADARLVDLIKRHGRWVEPPDSSVG